MLSFKIQTLLLRETMPVLRGSDPQRTSFILLYNTCSSVCNYSYTEKKALFYDSLLYIPSLSKDLYINEINNILNLMKIFVILC